MACAEEVSNSSVSGCSWFYQVVKMCQSRPDDKPGGTSLLSLDAEVLDLVNTAVIHSWSCYVRDDLVVTALCLLWLQVLCQLSAIETVRVAATCWQLSQLTCRGGHAARRWWVQHGPFLLHLASIARFHASLLFVAGANTA